MRAFVRYNPHGDAGLLRLLPFDVFSQVEVVAGDLRDSEALRSAMKGVDTVFHGEVFNCHPVLLFTSSRGHRYQCNGNAEHINRSS